MITPVVDKSQSRALTWPRKVDLLPKGEEVAGNTVFRALAKHQGDWGSDHDRDH